MISFKSPLIKYTVSKTVGHLEVVQFPILYTIILSNTYCQQSCTNIIHNVQEVLVVLLSKFLQPCWMIPVETILGTLCLQRLILCDRMWTDVGVRTMEPKSSGYLCSQSNVRSWILSITSTSIASSQTSLKINNTFPTLFQWISDKYLL